MEQVANDNVVDLTEDNEAEASAAQEDEDLYGAEVIEDVVVQNDENAENPVASEEKEDAEVEAAGEPGEDDENPFADDEYSDEEGGGVQVTIRRLEPTEKPVARQGKLDLDATPTINDKPIYDLDLAQMEDRPWKKPGADIADYFNYGFTEETWNLYCERQKKLRAEFAGNQQQANTALFSAIKISNPLANPVINNSSSVVKVLTDNGGRFKQPVHQHQPAPSPIQNEVIRTVISGNPASAPSLMDFTRPPPGMSMPPPMGLPITGAPPISIKQEAPPGIEASDLPPGIDSTPVSAAAGTAPPPFGGGLDLNLGLPHMGFNPNLPPPGMPPGIPPMGMLSNMPPPGFSMPPPAFGAQHSRAGFGPGPVASQPRGMMGGPGFGSDDDDERRARRKRSRSRSPRRGDRDREDRRDRDSRRRGEERSTRRHRSRSTSPDRRRRRDEREKRRDRDEDSRKKSSRSRRDEDGEERRGGEKRRTRTTEGEEEPPTGAAGNEEDSPSAE